MFHALAALALSVAGIPVGQAEVLCDLSTKAQANGETDFWPRAWAYLGSGQAVPVDKKIELLSFCLGRTVEKTRAVQAEEAALNRKR